MSMEMTRPERRGPEWGGVMAAMALVDQAEPGPGWGWGTATEECAGLLCILRLLESGHKSQSLTSELEL